MRKRTHGSASAKTTAPRNAASQSRIASLASARSWSSSSGPSSAQKRFGSHFGAEQEKPARSTAEPAAGATASGQSSDEHPATASKIATARAFTPRIIVVTLPPVVELRGGRYVLGRLLGQGAQASTFEAIDKREGRVVCIKRFSVRGAAAWKDVELAEREARVLASLSHDRLPRHHE